MPQRSRQLLESDGPLARFAIELRALRDAAPPGWTVDQVAEAEQVSRSTIYFALAGKRLPSVAVLKAMVDAWDPRATVTMREWLNRRRTIEGELSRAKAVGKQVRQDAASSKADDPITASTVPTVISQSEDIGPSSVVANPHLEALYAAAGRPSVRAIKREIDARHPGRDVSRATIHRVLTEATYTPSTDIVARVLAELSGADPNVMSERVAEDHDARSKAADGAEPGPVRPGRALSPIRYDAPPEVRLLAEELRSMLRETGLSVRQLARYMHYDSAIVSRYLKGDRVPSREFLIQLSAFLGRTEDDRVRLERLWRDAVKVSSPARSQIESLKAELEDARRRLADLGG